MRSLLNFLARFNSLIIFLILEGISIYLLATGNNYHNTRILLGIRGVTNGIESSINNTRDYLKLREINQILAAENIALKNSIGRLTQPGITGFISVTDSVYRQQYDHTSAEVINNSVNRQKNFFTLNKGTRHGVGVDMAITCDDGVVIAQYRF
jgi:rod shape-determining protein MreC